MYFEETFLSGLTKHFLMSSVSLLLFSGCASIDVPDKPSMETPAEITESLPTQFFNGDNAPLPVSATWWEAFQDPLLTALIEQA